MHIDIGTMVGIPCARKFFFLLFLFISQFVYAFLFSFSLVGIVELHRLLRWFTFVAVYATFFDLLMRVVTIIDHWNEVAYSIAPVILVLWHRKKNFMFGWWWAMTSQYWLKYARWEHITWVLCTSILLPPFSGYGFVRALSVAIHFTHILTLSGAVSHLSVSIVSLYLSSNVAGRKLYWFISISLAMWCDALKCLMRMLMMWRASN